MADTFKLHPDYIAALRRFHRSEATIMRHISDQSGVSHTTVHHALKGKPATLRTVELLEHILLETTRSPRKFLPDVGPRETDDLRAWLKSINTARWWYHEFDLADIGVSFGGFQNFMSGSRNLSNEEPLVDRLDAWWLTLMKAVEIAEDVAQCYEYSARPNSRCVGSMHTYWRRRIVEDQDITVDDARREHVRRRLNTRICDVIDLLDPKDPRRPDDRTPAQIERETRWAGEEFDIMVEDGYPNAVRTLPPDGFEPHQEWVEGRWGDRRDEEVHKDLNKPLYNLWYRDLCNVTWDRDTARKQYEEIRREVSVDAETWRPANEREQRGWDAGGLLLREFMEEHGEPPTNLYTLETEKIRRRITQLSAMRRQKRKKGDPSDEELVERIDELWRQLRAVPTD